MGAEQDFRSDRLTGNGLGVGGTALDVDRPARPNYETAADRTTSPPDASPEEIRRDIDRTRSEMDRTLDALGTRLDPRSLADDLWDMARSAIGGSRAGEKLTDKVADIDYAGYTKRIGASALDAMRENPIPTLLGGAAIAYMLFENPVRRQYRRSKYATVRDLPEYSGSVVDARTGEPYDMETYGAEYRAGSASSGPGVLERAKGVASGVAGGLSSAGSATVRTGRTVAGTTVSAGHTIAGAASTAGHAVGSAGQTVVESAKSAAEWAAEKAAAIGETLSGVTHRTAEVSRSTYGAVGQTARSTYGTVGESARSAYGAVGHGTSVAGESISRGARSGYALSRERYERSMSEAPLLVGLGCLALGIVAGFAIPRTRPEDELMGEQADRLKEEARVRAEEAYRLGKEKATTVYEQNREKATEVLEQGKEKLNAVLEQGKEKAAEVAVGLLDKAERSGMSPADLVEKASSKIHKAADSLASTARDKAQAAGGKATDKLDALSSVGMGGACETGSAGMASTAAKSGGLRSEPDLSANLGAAMATPGTTTAGKTEDFGDEMSGEGRFSAGNSTAGTTPSAGTFGTSGSAVVSDFGSDVDLNEKKPGDGGSCSV